MIKIAALITLVTSLVLLGEPATAAPTVNKLSCSTSGKLVDPDGTAIPSSVSNSVLKGHRLTWLDGNTSYLLQTGQLIAGGTTRPELNMTEEVAANGSAPNQKIDTFSSSTFYSDMDYDTQNMQTSYVYQDTTSADGLTLTTADITPNQSPRAPLSITVTSHPASPAGARKTVLTNQGAKTLPTGYVYKTYSETCLLTPSSMADMSFGGFFSAAKKQILKFDASHSAAMLAKNALADCEQKTPQNCEAQQRRVEASVAAREALWKTLFSTSDLTDANPALSDPGDSGNSGGGDSAAPSCSSSAFCSGSGQCINGQCVDSIDQRCDNGLNSCAAGEMCCSGSCSTHGSCN